MIDDRPDTIHQKFSYDGEDLVVVYSRLPMPDGYSSLTVAVRHAMSNEPWAQLSVHVIGDPDAELPEDEFWLKTYSENAEITRALLGLGIIELTGRTYELSQWASVPSAKLA
jgi:hypothetical protein